MVTVVNLCAVPWRMVDVNLFLFFLYERWMMGGVFFFFSRSVGRSGVVPAILKRVPCFLLAPSKKKNSHSLVKYMQAKLSSHLRPAWYRSDSKVTIREAWMCRETSHSSLYFRSDWSFHFFEAWPSRNTAHCFR